MVGGGFALGAGLLGLAAGLVAGPAAMRLADDSGADREHHHTAAHPDAQSVTLRGTVDDVATDVFGRTRSVAIVTSTGGVLVEMPVEDGEAGDALRQHVGRWVTAVGVMKVRTDGTTSLVVRRFTLDAES